MQSLQYDILLVEDDPVDAELILTALKSLREDLTIQVATDGEEALQHLFGTFGEKSFDGVPRVILLDLKLPKVNGFEVLRKVRVDERTHSVPVVMFSSSQEVSDIQTCYQLGANSYIVKPVNAEEFLSTVSAVGKYWIELNEVAKMFYVKFSV